MRAWPCRAKADRRVERRVGRRACVLVDHHVRTVPPTLSAVAYPVLSAFIDASRPRSGRPAVVVSWSATACWRVLSRACGRAGRHPDGREPGRARTARSAAGVLPAVPAAGNLPLVVIWFGIDETAKLVVGCRADRDGRACRRRSATAEPVIALIAGDFAVAALRRVARRPSHRVRLALAGPRWWPRNGGQRRHDIKASSFLRTDVVVMGIVLIGLIAWIAFATWGCGASRRLVPWKGRVLGRPDNVVERSVRSTALQLRKHHANNWMDRPVPGSLRNRTPPWEVAGRHRMRDPLKQRHVVDRIAIEVQPSESPAARNPGTASQLCVRAILPSRKSARPCGAGITRKRIAAFSTQFDAQQMLESQQPCRSAPSRHVRRGHDAAQVAGIDMPLKWLAGRAGWPARSPRS